MALEKIPNLALKLINKYGTTVQVILVTEGAYNTDTSSLAKTESAPITCKGLLEEFPDTIRFLGDKLKTGSTVLDSDKRFTVAANALTVMPSVGDKMIAQGSKYTIVGMAVQMAAENPAYYVYHIRRK